MSMKNPLTPAGIEPATFRFVTQHLNHCTTTVPNRSEYQEYFLWGKYGRCLELTTLPPPCVSRLEIWEPQPPGTRRVYPSPYRDWCTFPSTIMSPYPSPTFTPFTSNAVPQSITPTHTTHSTSDNRSITMPHATQVQFFLMISFLI